MDVLTREQLLARRAPPKTRDVPVPELGEGVVIRVRALYQAEFEGFMATAMDRNGGKESRAKPDFNRRLIQLAAVDPGGNRVFDGDEGLALIGETLTPGTCVKLVKEISDLSGGLNETEEEQAKN